MRMKSSSVMEYAWLIISAGAAALVCYNTITTNSFTEDDWIVSGTAVLALGMFFLRRWRRRLLEKTMDS